MHQQGTRPIAVIEKYTKNARFCLICNYVSKIIPALQSRCTRFRFSPLEPDQIRLRLGTVIANERYGCASPPVPRPHPAPARVPARVPTPHPPTSQPYTRPRPHPTPAPGPTPPPPCVPFAPLI